MKTKQVTMNILEADEGKLLTNGKNFAKVVYVSDENSKIWEEVDESEIPQEENENIEE